MFKSKLTKSLTVLVAAIIVAIAIPTALGANNAQASGNYTFNGQAYKSATAKQRAAKHWQSQRLTETQKQLVQAANREAATSTRLSHSFSN
ncbi:hypothetical protein [Levilactobacillus parabrevis]|uniref:Uncharacterized protein n=1 Tax=Levilactobacillus parabrevis ATCC 53295 TaxID=1267003 RepID=A0A0R1H761_9LACO|nr:hypothetical protein [Levilactobacillus parabrevis]KRK39338.1 hypothetical protein FD07_GL001132 [Levilactobacillus parabrevis ATCC 53295]KRO07239.1 hypothetical protein IV61_GL000046 [Levilactobacillus parabrevis]